MAIRKSTTEELSVDGARERWFDQCLKALKTVGFTDVAESRTLFQLEAKYHKWLTWGELQVTLLPAEEQTRIVLRATGNYDNVWALLWSPNKTILTAFKHGLTGKTTGASCRRFLRRKLVAILIILVLALAALLLLMDRLSEGSWRNKQKRIMDDIMGTPGDPPVQPHR